MSGADVTCRLCGNKPQERGGKGLCSVHYRRKLAYRGEPQGWVSPDNTMAHIAKLRADGLSLRRIAEMTGMNEDAVSKIAKGRRGRIQALTEEKVLAIGSAGETPEKKLADLSFVPGFGTARRIRSLSAIGYSQQFIAGETGLARSAVTRIANERHPLVRAYTAERIAELFNRLQMVPAPDAPTARKVRTLAERRGWAIPLAWDEDTIDDPDSEPDLGARKRRSDWVEDYVELRGLGLSDARIAQRMRIHPDSLQQKLRRLREKAA